MALFQRGQDHGKAMEKLNISGVANCNLPPDPTAYNLAGKTLVCSA